MQPVLDYTGIPMWIVLASGLVWILAIVGGAFLARTLWHYVNRSPKS
jgi:hypothetical protein